jgi:hypothetical protein
MAGHRPFSDIAIGFTEERRARVAQKAATTMSRTLGDVRVSHLRRCVEALGATLEITARFPDASVILTNIGEDASS